MSEGDAPEVTVDGRPWYRSPHLVFGAVAARSFVLGVAATLVVLSLVRGWSFRQRELAELEWVLDGPQVDRATRPALEAAAASYAVVLIVLGVIGVVLAAAVFASWTWGVEDVELWWSEYRPDGGSLWRGLLVATASAVAGVWLALWATRGYAVDSGDNPTWQFVGSCVLAVGALALAWFLRGRVLAATDRLQDELYADDYPEYVPGRDC